VFLVQEASGFGDVHSFAPGNAFQPYEEQDHSVLACSSSIHELENSAKKHEDQIARAARGDPRHEGATDMPVRCPMNEAAFALWHSRFQPAPHNGC
jgi:hypothetical protein